MKKIILAVVLLLSATANATTRLLGENVHELPSSGHIKSTDGLVSSAVFNRPC